MTRAEFIEGLMSRHDIDGHQAAALVDGLDQIKDWVGAGLDRCVAARMAHVLLDDILRARPFSEEETWIAVSLNNGGTVQ